MNDSIAQGKSLLSNSQNVRDTLSKLYYKYPNGSQMKDTIGMIIHDSNHDFGCLVSYIENKNLNDRKNKLYDFLKRCHRWYRIIELIVILEGR